MSNLGNKKTDDDEVEQLLRAAQDDMLLKLSVNSHVARASASAAIDPDLDRRFLALKKPQKLKKPEDSAKRVPKEADTGDSKAAGAPPEDDLFTRFAALKSTLPSHGGKEINIKFPREGSVDQDVTEEDDDEDEVEKVIRWAVDAARLDPSPPSDDDDLDHKDDSSDDDDDGVRKGKKSNRK